MDNSQDRQKEIYRAQKEMLAYLNAKQDSRATSKELIDNINCQTAIFCESAMLLHAGEYITGPVFTKEMVAQGGNNNFRDSTQLTEAGQGKYIAMIRDEQPG